LKKMEYGVVFGNGLKQFEDAAKHVKDVPEDVLEFMKKPKRTLMAFIPVKMDSGKLQLFEGYRVQFNDVCGPFKGGIRYHPGVTLDEVTALSFWMTWKTLVCDLPLGGGKGGVIADPKKMSKRELEELSRGYVRAFDNYLGSDKDVPAPDVYTNAEVMGWMLDEHEKLIRKKDPGFITGKPVEKGGSLGRDKATAQGGAYVLEEAVKSFGLKDRTMAVQGFGNAGMTMAKLAEKAGYCVVAVSDSQGGVFNPTGLNVDALVSHKEKNGSVSGFEGTKSISNEELLELEVGVLVPAALENQVTEKNAGKIKAKMILELANGPVTPCADKILFEKNIIIIPDILANSGGVTVSYFEWFQNVHDEKWSAEKVDSELKKRMAAAFANIHSIHLEYNVDLRTSAYIYCIKKMHCAMKEKGIV
jgi:glutamate dehydrogenase (NAD(P)+)